MRNPNNNIEEVENLVGHINHEILDQENQIGGFQRKIEISNSTIFLASLLAVGGAIYDVIKVNKYDIPDFAKGGDPKLEPYDDLSTLPDFEANLRAKAVYDTGISLVPAIIATVFAVTLVAGSRNGRVTKNSNIASISGSVFATAASWLNTAMSEDRTKIDNYDIPKDIKDSYNDIRSDIMYDHRNFQTALFGLILVASAINLQNFRKADRANVNNGDDFQGQDLMFPQNHAGVDVEEEIPLENFNVVFNAEAEYNEENNEAGGRAIGDNNDGFSEIISPSPQARLDRDGSTVARLGETICTIHETTV